MRRYYELKLNCARVRNNDSLSDACGFIEIFPRPIITVKKGIFGKKEIITFDYSGEYNVIAELTDDGYFKDIILGAKIYFDPNGVRNIKSASEEELKSQLDVGLTCFSFSRVDSGVTKQYLKAINGDLGVVHKYIDEITMIKNKDNVKEELELRLNKSYSMYGAQIEKNSRQRVRKIKSA